MTCAGSGTSHYVVTAKAQRGVVREIRMRATSAVVLAERRMAAGYEAMQIVDPLGKILSPDGYRAAIMGGGRADR